MEECVGDMSIEVIESRRRNYVDQQRVIVSMKKEDGIEWHYSGKIIGVGTRGIIDQWIVELDGYIDDYPYKCLVIPHIMIEEERK